MKDTLKPFFPEGMDCGIAAQCTRDWLVSPSPTQSRKQELGGTFRPSLHPSELPFASLEQLGLEHRDGVNYALYLALRRAVHQTLPSHVLREQEILFFFNLCQQCFADASRKQMPELMINSYLFAGHECPGWMSEDLHNLLCQLKPMVLYVMAKADKQQAAHFELLCEDLVKHFSPSLAAGFFAQRPMGLEMPKIPELPVIPASADGESQAAAAKGKKKKLSLFYSAEVESTWVKHLQVFFSDELGTPIDSSLKQPVLYCMICFMKEWQKHGLIARISLAPCLRLMQKCGFTFDADEKAIGNVLGRMLKAKPTKKNFQMMTDANNRVTIFVHGMMQK